MDDLEYRRQAVVKPIELKKALIENNQTSGENNRFLDEQLDFEKQLQETLEVSVPDNLAEKILFSQVSTNTPEKGNNLFKKIYRVAAVFIAIGFGVLVLFNQELFKHDNTADLPGAVLTHMYEDSHALDTYREYSKVDVNTMLASMGGKLSGPIGNISYLSRCIMGKHMGLHMVVRTPNGLVTVLLLPDEVISGHGVLADENYSGIIIPSKKGAVVFVSEKTAESKNTQSINKSEPNYRDIIQERVEKNLRWII